MADKLRSKAPSIEVHVQTGEAQKAAAALGKTLNSIAAGIPLNEYFRDTSRLIDDVRDTYRQFQRELSNGAVNDATAQSLMKTANALSALAAASRQQVTDLVPEFNSMQSAIAAATKQAGMLSAAFSVENYKAAFDSFKRLEAEGVNLDNVFKNLGSNAAYDKLLEENETLQRQLARSRSEVEDLQRNFDRLASTDISSLQCKLDTLYDQAEYEVNAFFEANNVPQTWVSGYESAIERIRDANKTSGEVITEWKRDFGDLLGQSVHGTGSPIDPELFDELAAKMQPIMDRIGELETVIRGIGSGSAGGGTGELKAVVETLTESGQAAEGATKLLSVLEQITSGSTDNIEMLRRTLNALADLDKIKISKAAMTNLGDFLTKIKEVPDVSRLAALSSINLNGFNNLSIKKASLENLATYLPTIANVNVDALAKISALPLDKFNNLTVQVDFGKQRFQEEADGVQNLNEKFKEHTGIIEQAIRAENAKYDASKRLTDQLRDEKNALEATPGASSRVTGGSHTPQTNRQLSEEDQRARQEAQMWAAYEKEQAQEAKAYSEYRAQMAKAEAEAEKQARREVADFEKAEAEAAKQIASEEAQMWAAYEQQKTEEAKAWSEQRAKDAAAAAKETARLEQEASDAVAAANRDDWGRQEELFDRAAKRHTAELKEKTRAEQAASKEAEQAAKNQQKAAEQQIKTEQRLEAQHARAGVTYDKLTNKVTTYFHNFEDEIKKNPALMAQYEQLLNNLNTKSFGDNMTNAAAAVQKFQLACEQAGIGANSFLKRLVSGFANKVFYGGLAKAAAELRRLVMQIYTNVKDIDAAMTQLQIVTGASDAQMEQFLTQSTLLARELGQSISDVMKSIETFSRLGYNLPDASELARYATILSNVAAVDVGTATTGLTSIIKAFGMQVSDSEHVADVLVNVGQKYAISAEELMASFERGGSALAATGTSFDKASALFAAANASMQNAEKIGTAIQTVSARIRGAKSELEDLGADYEDVAEGVSKYRKELMALTNVTGTGGFDIMADVNTNTYKDIYDIFVGIAGVWNQLSDTSQARVAEILGGTRQLSVISSVIKNISDAQGALETAQNSTGVALKANDTYLESIQGRVGVLTADFQDMSQSILNSGLIKFGVSALDILVRGIDKLAEAKVLLPGIAAIITGINAVDKWKHLNAGMDLFMTSMKASTQMTGSLASSFMSLNQVQQQYALNNSMIANDTVAHGIKQLSVINALDLAKKRELATTLRAYYVSIGKTEAEIQDALALRGLSDAQLQQAAAAEDGEVANMGFAASLKAMWASNPVGLIMMVASLLASVLIPVLNKVIVTAKEAREQYEQEASELNSLKSEYETNASRIEELNNLKATDAFSETNQRELEQLQDKNTQLERELALKQAITDEDRKEAVEKSSKKFNSQLYYTGNGLTNAEGVFAYADAELVKIEAAFASLEASGLYETDSRQYAQKKAEIEAWQESVYKTVRRVLKNYDEVKDYLNKDTHAVYDSLVDKWVGLILGKDKSADTKVENPIEQVENGIVSSAKTITSVLKQLGVEITAIYGKGGKVDLVNRPSVTVTSSNLAKVQSWGIDAQLGNTMTVASQTYRDAKKAIVVTPILPDGSMLTQNELDRYIDEVILKTAQAGDGDYAKNDEKGLIMSVFGDKGTWEENLAQSEEFANKVHEIHEMLLSDVLTPEEAESARRMLQALVPNADAMKPLDTLRDDIAALSTAFKDLSAEGSLGVTYKSLSQIRERFADVDGIDTYINRLAAAGTNAKEVQGILRELAYQQIIASDNSEALANASDDVIEVLLREAGVASDGKQAIYELRLAMIAANTTGMDFSQQCSAILEIAAAAGVATASLRNMFKAAAGEYSERTGEDYSGNLDEYGYVYGTEARRGQYQNSQQTANTAWITKQAAAAGLSVEQFTIQKAYEQIRQKMLSSFEFSGDNGTTGGSGGSVEDYVADIDKYREAIHKLNQIQEERAKLERTIEHTDDPWKQIGLLSQETGLYQQEQKALHTLNNLRRATITENIKQLENLGFVVQYNADTNDLWIENLEHLNELDQKIIKETEELCDQTVELNKANQEASENWWELKDSIAKTDTQINELLQTIVDNASKAVDSMQSVYDTLHQAADEYASSGFVTIDTVQALIGLGTEYMQYLLDENGQLVINEERIKAAVKAKMEQLAVDNALVYVEALSIAQTKGDTEELNRLLFATEKAANSTWDLVYAKIEALKLSDEERAAAYHNVNSIRALAQSAGDAVGNEFEQMKRGVDDILKYVQEMLKHQSQEAIDTLNKQKEAYSEIIDQQKTALQLKKKENDYNKSVEQKLKDIAKLQAQIDALSLDNSREAQAQRAKLLEDLANLQEDLAL